MKCPVFQVNQPPSGRWESGNPALFAGFPSTMGKSALILFQRASFPRPVGRAVSSPTSCPAPYIVPGNAVREVIPALFYDWAVAHPLAPEERMGTPHQGTDLRPAAIPPSGGILNSASQATYILA